VPLFRSRNHFRVPTIKVVPLLVVLVALALVGGVVALALIEPAPPLRHYEVPVPSERLSR
jgi:hypothetical protein